MNPRVARSRLSLGLLAGLVTLTLMAASCDPPGATAFTVGETVGRQSNFELDGGPLRRQVRVTIPAGALEGATEGHANLAISTRTAVSAVQFDIGAPAAGVAIVDEPGNRGFDFAWTLPEDCEGGCEVLVPVTISHVGDGEPPRLVWSMHFTIAYESAVPAAAEDLPDAIIEAADGTLGLGCRAMVRSWAADLAIGWCLPRVDGPFV